MVDIQQIVFLKSYQNQSDRVNALEVKKLNEAIITKGYWNFNIGFLRGVMPIKSSDKNLWKAYHQYLELLDPEEKSHLAQGFPVKVVADVISGSCMVGFLVKDNKKYVLYILGFAHP